ncbi:ABC transporter permease [Homoserinimonas sp. OAct 916]|uniref:ABC transporter permease n=1 Tax=Homoserinimonas sp. OAct 916 TaxID=2211450 RepID=UPI000DBE85C7|nr:ABC transporter permease [Homoserinimonas sp. OAct 916]
MSTRVAARSAAPDAALPRAGVLADAALGVGILMRFILRRNWLRMLIWLIVLAGMVVLVIDSQRSLFPTQADRDAYAKVANTPAIAALTGLPYAAGTLGGILNIKLWMTVAIGLSFAVIFMVNRNGRAEEESGRTELLRSGVLGKNAYSLANWLVFSAFAVVVGLACSAAAISQGLPADGAFVMGGSFAGVGFVFVGVAAIAGQLARTSRGANALASTVLAVSYLIRAVADVNATDDRASWLTWLSPIGWGQQTRSYGENLWWPLLLCLAGGTLLCGIALALERRRDLGAGLLPDRVGPRTASALVRTQVGLSLRLQRGSLIGWTVGIIVGGLFFGGVAKAMVDLLKPDNPITQAFVGGSTNVLDGLLGFFLMANALLVAAFVLQSTDSIRAEEAAGRTEIQWSSAISRVRWAAARMVVPAVASLGLLALSGACVGLAYGAAVDDPSQSGRFALASLAYWPTALLMVGLVVFCAAVIPRAAAAVTWGIYGVVVILSMFGDLFGLPDWVTKNTPFTAVPRLDETFTILPLVVITVLVLVAGGVGLWVLQRRDMVSA